MNNDVTYIHIVLRLVSATLRYVYVCSPVLLRYVSVCYADLMLCLRVLSFTLFYDIVRILSFARVYVYVYIRLYVRLRSVTFTFTFVYVYARRLSFTPTFLYVYAPLRRCSFTCTFAFTSVYVDVYVCVTCSCLSLYCIYGFRCDLHLYTFSRAIDNIPA